MGEYEFVMCPNKEDNFFDLITSTVFKENAYFHISSSINSNPEGMDYSVIQGSDTRKLKWSSDIFFNRIKTSESSVYAFWFDIFSVNV